MPPFALPLAIILLGMPEVPSTPAPSPLKEPLAAMRELRPDFLAGEKCRDSNLPIAGKPGQQPRLDRRPATEDKAQAIYAVDRRIDGCSVVLAIGNPLPPTRPFHRIELTPEQKAELARKR